VPESQAVLAFGIWLVRRESFDPAVRPTGVSSGDGGGGIYAPGAKILEDVDVANVILYAVTQPTHVNVSELLIRPTIQAL